ncbi:MAG: division/cell wall cluster transcriptional repressor MraZ [Acidimicrobiia bacterium]|nr:division/cell wall cluster transcriptional repressor MraZ [Acidimicrobiia bacterium]
MDGTRAHFLGEYQHALDAKGRFILPARFRDQLGDVAYVTSEEDGCLALWRPEEFEMKANEIRERARAGERDVQRAFFAGAMEASPDRQGRVAVPQGLRDFAGLERDVVVVGLFDHMEIWDAAAWRRTRQVGEQRLAAGGAAPAATS